jgi:hypothetical protein
LVAVPDGNNDPKRSSFIAVPQKEITRENKAVALVTGANRGIGLQIAKDLVAHGFTVLVGSRNLERGEAAAKEVGSDTRAPARRDGSGFDRRRGGAHPEGAWPPRRAGQQRGYLAYE